MTEVIRLETFRSRMVKSRPLSDVGMMAELTELRHAAALLESDLAQVKQRLLEELVERQEDGETA